MILYLVSVVFKLYRTHDVYNKRLLLLSRYIIKTRKPDQYLLNLVQSFISIRTYLYFKIIQICSRRKRRWLYVLGSKGYYGDIKLVIFPLKLHVIVNSQ